MGKAGTRLRAVLEWDEALSQAAADGVSDHPTFIYVMAGDGPTVKVGLSLNLGKRLRCVRAQAGRYLELVFSYECLNRLHAHLIERATHELLGEYRALGEWFKVTPEQAEKAVLIACDHYSLEHTRARLTRAGPPVRIVSL